jgi:hypothetical protein
MALDTDMKALLDQMVAAKVQSFHQMTPQAAREQMARRTVRLARWSIFTAADGSLVISR